MPTPSKAGVELTLSFAKKRWLQGQGHAIAPALSCLNDEDDSRLSRAHLEPNRPCGIEPGTDAVYQVDTLTLMTASYITGTQALTLNGVEPPE